MIRILCGGVIDGVLRPTRKPKRSNSNKTSDDGHAWKADDSRTEPKPIPRAIGYPAVFLEWTG